MKLSIFSFATLSVASAGPLAGERDLRSYTYEKYQKDFGKSALTVSLHANKRQAFEANLEVISKHNAHPFKTWYANVNQFTDWTPSEFRARRGRGKLPSRSDVIEQTTAFAGSESVDLGLLPHNVDWRRQPGVVTPIKDQGDCGSCWAFSVAETMESALALATGRPAPILSPQQLLSCMPNPNHCGGAGGCDGGEQPVGFNYTIAAGLTTEENYPYQAVTGTCNYDDLKPVAQNSGLVALPVNNYAALLSAVARVGPISISVATNHWQHYGGGVFNGHCGLDQDHAVQLVGYGIDHKEKYWLVRNSWGGSWGEDGYIRIKRYGEGQEPCGRDETPQDGGACAGDTKPMRVCGHCAILSDSSYPTGVRRVDTHSIIV